MREYLARSAVQIVLRNVSRSAVELNLRTMNEELRRKFVNFYDTAVSRTVESPNSP